VKKVFVILGIIFLVLIVAGGIGIWYIAARGNTLDKESKAYANTAIPAIFTNWNKNEFASRSSPEFKQATTDDQLNPVWQRWTSGLGRLMTFDSPKGQALMSATTAAGKRVTAEYDARAYFEKGDVIIRLKLIKHGDQWQILALNIAPSQSAPR
jgi:hypothetical protein